MLRIVCDMDGVICDLIGWWTYLLNRYHGTNIKRDDVTEWDIHAACPEIFKEEVYKYLGDPGFFLHLDPIPGALEGLRGLIQRGHDVVIATACEYGHADKRLWLKRHLPELPHQNIVFIERKELIPGDVFIDDRLENLEKWSEANGMCGDPICFDAPYNRSWGGIRAKSWDEIITRIERKVVASIW
jgi:5'(3')-deoxyribonucleotidase